MSSTIDKAVSIRCKGASEIRLEELIAFQGNLKDLSEENYNKFKNVILTQGFSEAISVWQNEGKNHILNGHQRLRVLQGLQAEGYFVPPIPVTIVMADNEKEAREKVLTLTSQYGEVTDTGLYEYMTMSGIDVSFLENVRLVEIDQDKWIESYVDGSEKANTSKELDLSTFDKFKHQCPKCGFEWNDNEKDRDTSSDGSVEP